MLLFDSHLIKEGIIETDSVKVQSLAVRDTFSCKDMDGMMTSLSIDECLYVSHMNL